MNALELFNLGKAIKIDEGSSGYAKMPCTIMKVTLAKSKFKDDHGNDNYQFEINVDVDGTEAILRQGVHFKENGELKNFAYGPYTAKDGKQILPTVIYELKEAAKLKDPEGYAAKAKKYTQADGSRNWKPFLEGLQFDFDAKVFDRKDGSGSFAILGTARQLKKDDEYFNKPRVVGDLDITPEEVDNAANLDDLF